MKVTMMRIRRNKAHFCSVGSQDDRMNPIYVTYVEKFTRELILIKSRFMESNPNVKYAEDNSTSCRSNAIEFKSMTITLLRLTTSDTSNASFADWMLVTSILRLTTPVCIVSSMPKSTSFWESNVNYATIFIIQTTRINISEITTQGYPSLTNLGWSAVYVMLWF